MKYWSNYDRIKSLLWRIRCQTCNGSGECNDLEPGDISGNTWKCNDCNGTGFHNGNKYKLKQK